MILIDSHIHWWNFENDYYDWLRETSNCFLGDITPLKKNYLLEDYLADTSSVKLQGFIHIEASSTPFALQEVVWLIQTYGNNPLLKGIVAGIDLTQPCESLLKTYATYPLIKGVRELVFFNPQSLKNPFFYQQLDLLTHHRFRLEMLAGPDQLKTVADIAERHPELIIILNHAGLPFPDRWDEWREGIRSCGKQPNIYVKFSGIGLVDQQWTARAIRPIAHELLERFGIHRCLFGSNFPVDKLYKPYSIMIDNYYQCLAELKSDEIQRVFCDNAEQIYCL